MNPISKYEKKKLLSNAVKERTQLMFLISVAFISFILELAAFTFSLTNERVRWDIVVFGAAVLTSLLHKVYSFLYGYKNVLGIEITTSFVNALLLTLAGVVLLFQLFVKMFSGMPFDFSLPYPYLLIGIAAKAMAIFYLTVFGMENQSAKTLFYHVLVSIMVSVLTALSLLLKTTFPITMLLFFTHLIIVFVAVWWSFNCLKNAFSMLSIYRKGKKSKSYMEEKLKKNIGAVTTVNYLSVWENDKKEWQAEMSVLLKKSGIENPESIREKIKELLKESTGITNLNIEMVFKDS